MRTAVSTPRLRGPVGDFGFRTGLNQAPLGPRILRGTRYKVMGTDSDLSLHSRLMRCTCFFAISFAGCGRRRANRVVVEATALLWTGTPPRLRHRPVRNSLSTQGSPPVTLASPASIAHASRSKLALPAAAAARTRQERKLAVPKRQRDQCWSLRPRQQPHGCLQACGRAGDAAAGRQALAATICQQTCRMLESYAVVRVPRSAEVRRKVLAQRDAYQR